MPDARTPEHRPLLRGEGRFVDDLRPAGALELAFVRSPWPHARIVRVATDRARAARGVAVVVTGAELARSVHPIRADMDPAGPYLYRSTDWHPIASDTVRHVGEIVAAVAAVDRYLAEDAAALVEVEYEPLETVADAGAAYADGAPLVHAHAPANLLFRIERTVGDPAVFDCAPIRVRFACRHPRVSGMPMEGSGVAAVHDRHTGSLELVSSTQAPHLLRTGLARCLGIHANRIRVRAPDVGGGFGPKMQLLPEEVVAAALAVRLGRPVQWTQDRMEHLQAGFHSRDVTVEAEASATADGLLVGLRARALCDVGAYSAYPLTCSLEPQTVGVALPGPYRLPHYRYEGLGIATHKYPIGAYRGVGFPLGPLVTEELVTRVGRAAGLDPAEVRRRNLLRPDELPYRSPGGAVYDSGDYPELLSRAIDRAPYDEWRGRQRAFRGEGAGGAGTAPGSDAGGSAASPRRRLGIGIASFVESTGMNRTVYRMRGMANIPAFDSAVLRVDPFGGVEAFVSTPSQGQSQSDSFRRLAGRALGVPEASVRVVLGDTAVTPYGSGTFASRSMVSGGGAVLRAAAKMREKLCAVAAARWAAGRDEVRFAVRGGRGGVERIGAANGPGSPEREGAPASGEMSDERGGGPWLGIEEIAHLAHAPLLPLPPDLEPGLEVHAAYDPAGVPVSCAAHLALVEVDDRTGGVRVLRYVVAEDCGPIVNPGAVDGQVRGAVVQGIGCALLESIEYDASGQHVSGTLMDYLVPAMGDAPEIDIVHMETPSPFTEGGIKGIGESGTIGAPAAIVNAVLDAFGAEPAELVLPLTPERVLALAGCKRSQETTSA